MEITDILFEHNFHSIEVTKKYDLNSVKLKDVVISYCCTVIGKFKPSRDIPVIVMLENVKITLDDVTDINKFIKYDDISKYNFDVWGEKEINKAEKNIYETFIFNSKNKTHQHLPRYFLNFEEYDDFLFRCGFPIKHIDQNQYLIKEDLINIYKTDITERVEGAGDHLLLCDYIAGALKKCPKEYVRNRLKYRKYNGCRGFGFSAKSTEYYLTVFDYYMEKNNFISK